MTDDQVDAAGAGAPGWRHALDIPATTDEEIVARRVLMRHQLNEASTRQRVPCASCPFVMVVWNLYRCRHCGLFFCPRCADRHFGPAKP